MIKVIRGVSLQDHMTYNLKFEPENKCPMCHTAFDGYDLGAYLIPKEKINPKLYVLHFCHTCEKPFLSAYTAKDNNENSVFRLAQSVPAKYEAQAFPDSIQTLSPQFVEIYNQALSAEKYGLFEICGVGYRKALEFLVKDYVIYKNPNEKENIIKMFLSPCINTYIQDRSPQIKELATKSAWLGNDETHYVRKHDDRDISDMKNFINAIVYYISMEFIVEDAISIQPK